MAAAIRSNTLSFAAIVIAALLHFSAAQTTYTVGNTMGWTIPQGGASAYSTWAANNSFAVGDILVFNFAVGAHDVTKVTKANYDSCTGTNPLMTSTTSPARVTLNSSGEHYFICNFPGHCNAGQKVTVNVLASTSSPSPAPMASSPAPMPSSPAPRRALSPASAPSPSSTVTAPTPSTSPVAGDGPSSSPAPSSRQPMTYTVGDSFGWNIPTNRSLFRDWASGKDFMVGDSLVFNYAAGAHNVAEVTSDGYTACRTANPISLDSNPPSRITLTTPGEHFYICAIAGHCSAGQQLSINVTGATGTTSGSPSGSATPPPSGSATPPPAGDSNSATSVGVSVVAFLSVFVAMLL
ncbi:Blue copper protein [Linum perenne]